MDIQNIDLPTHELASQERAKQLMSKLNSLGDKMTDGVGNVKDKVDVNIFGDTRGGGGMDGIWASVLPALAAERGNRGDGFGGLGSGFIGGVIGGALFGGRRGGLFGGGDGDCGGGGAETRVESDIFNTAVLAKLGTIEAAIPLAACTTQAAVASAEANLTNVTLQQTIALERDLGSLALGTQQGFANTKDAVQATAALLGTAISNTNQNVSAQGCQTREAIQNDGDKTRALLVARFQLEDATTIANLNNQVTELRNEGRSRANHDELRLQITNTNTAVAAQQQGQAQFQQQQILATLATLVPSVNALINESQVARATNANLIFGNTGAVATGAQTNTPTNVRA